MCVQLKVDANEIKSGAGGFYEYMYDYEMRNPKSNSYNPIFGGDAWLSYLKYLKDKNQL